MGTITAGRFALTAGIAAGPLAGCSAPFAPAPQSVPAQRTVHLAAHAFAGETFTSSYVKAACLLTPGGPDLQYTVSGSASGPYPGTFTASGSVFDFALRSTLTFSETFDVSSGSQTYSGTAQVKHGITFPGCLKHEKQDRFKASDAPYKVDGSHGRTEARYSRMQFTESFR